MYAADNGCNLVPSTAFPDSVTGDVLCPLQYICDWNVKCTGTLNGPDTSVTGPEDCLAECQVGELERMICFEALIREMHSQNQAETDCTWYSYDSNGNVCLFFEECASPPSCATCTTGQRECQETDFGEEAARQACPNSPSTPRGATPSIPRQSGPDQSKEKISNLVLSHVPSKNFISTKVMHSDLDDVCTKYAGDDQKAPSAIYLFRPVPKKYKVQLFCPGPCFCPLWQILRSSRIGLKFLGFFFSSFLFLLFSADAFGSFIYVQSTKDIIIVIAGCNYQNCGPKVVNYKTVAVLLKKKNL